MMACGLPSLGGREPSPLLGERSLIVRLAFTQHFDSRPIATTVVLGEPPILIFQIVDEQHLSRNRAWSSLGKIPLLGI